MLMVKSQFIILLLGWGLGFLTFLVTNTGCPSNALEPPLTHTPTTGSIGHTTAGNEIPITAVTTTGHAIPQGSVGNGSVTIVGIWYELERNKYGGNPYINWAKNYFALECDMVIWTDEANVGYVREYRKGMEHRTKIVMSTLDNITILNQFNWEKQLEMDPERGIHNIGLYKVWNGKIDILKRTAEWNPFNTEFFFYFDVGYFRDTKQFKKWPSTEVLKHVPRDRVVFLQVYPWSTDEFNGRVRFFTKQLGDRMGGGAIGGTLQAITKYHSIYYPLCKEYEDNVKFFGKDQNVFATIATNYPDTVLLVQRDAGQCGDIWFFLRAWLADPSELGGSCFVSHALVSGNMWK